tara:strand:+ start:52097 stop:53101 length:1005 start_codon:yes stop_codon:yes gene_type:complete
MKKQFFKPVYALSILAVSTGLILGSCKKDEEEPEPTPEPTPEMQSSTYNYEFNNGQVVASAAYDGMHMDNLTAMMEVEEVSANETMISVTLMNTVDGETYMIHAHDAADPANTPNGTPYDETPNGNVFTQMANGNGGDVTVSQTVSMSYSSIVNDYEGFFVVHDPLQTLSTVDISTYLIVGSFARTQAASNLSSMTYNYDFNTGQIDPSYAYSGSHATDLGATLKVQELADGTSRVSVSLMNSINGETYMVHAHDQADPMTTPNGTPYDETPNADVLAISIDGNGMTAYNNQISTMSYADLTSNYSAFFVVHDPLQAIDTTDPTTYVVLGVFAG